MCGISNRIVKHSLTWIRSIRKRVTKSRFDGSTFEQIVIFVVFGTHFRLPEVDEQPNKSCKNSHKVGRSTKFDRQQIRIWSLQTEICSLSISAPRCRWFPLDYNQLGFLFLLRIFNMADSTPLVFCAGYDVTRSAGGSLRFIYRNSHDTKNKPD